MQKYLGHAQGIGNQASVLATGSAKAAEHVLGDVVAALDRDFFNGVGHLFHRNGQKPGGHLLRAAKISSGPVHFRRQGRELLPYDLPIQG